MPSECCYFVDKAAAADAAPALYYFGSILHCFAVFTQNLGQTSRILEGYGYEAYNFAGGFRFYDAVVNDRALIEKAYSCGMDK